MSIAFNLLKKISRKVICKSLVIGDQLINDFLNDKAYLLICSNSVEKKFKDSLFKGAKRTIVNPPIEIAELDELILALKEEMMNLTIDWVLACGGGRVNDAAKYISKKIKRNLCIIPPILSTTNWLNGAIALRNSNILAFAGTKWPDKILFDTAFLLENPKELHTSGIADILCCSSALYDWKLASVHSKEHFSNVGYSQYQAFIEKVIGKPEIFTRLNKDSLVIILEYFIEAMSLCGASMSGRPLEGSEHFFYYYLDELTEKPLIHGNVIAITSVLCLLLQSENAAVPAEKMVEFYRTIGIDFHYVPLVQEHIQAVQNYVEKRNYGYSILNKIDTINNLGEILEKFNNILGNKSINSLQKQN